MDSFYVMPVGSIYSRPEQASVGYLDIIEELPIAIKGMISSVETVSYIKGLSRAYDTSEEGQAAIAFAILEITIGKKTTTQLSAILSTELKLPNNKAQKMALEIEHDIFGPIKRELDMFLQQQKIKGASATNITAPTPLNPASTRQRTLYQPQNVLNLKELETAKKQNQITAKPRQPQLSPRPSTSTPTPNTAQKPTFPLPPRTQRVEPPASEDRPIHFE